MSQVKRYKLLGELSGGRRGSKGFTLVELLVVVAIIAMLVGILMPTLGRARDLARRAVCGAQMNAMGKASLLYQNECDSYPPMGDWRFPGGWPKFYGILQAMDVAAPGKVRGMSDYSPWEADEVWDKSFCPSMKAAAILREADDAMSKGISPAKNPAKYRAAAGYQWNVTLRAAGARTSLFADGRWPLELWKPSGDYDNTLWLDYPIWLPGELGDFYICQAISAQELLTPATIAEAWDGHDLDTIPGMNFRDAHWDVENLVPGWHVGPQSKYTNGWAVLNGARHPTSPNVLYADGHVAGDATKRLTSSDLGDLPYGTFDGAKLNSWDDYIPTYGTLNHIVPRTEIRLTP